MNSKNFRCRHREPSFSIEYSVAGDKKCYDVCSECINLDCFSKFILNKAPAGSIKIKNEKNHFSKKYDESEDMTEQQTEGDEVTAASTEETERPITFAEELS
jgi:hypothetical protein